MEQTNKVTTAVPVPKDSTAVQAAPTCSTPSLGHSVPSQQVWSKYVDSRMKQFGSR